MMMPALAILLVAGGAGAQLSPGFYSSSCPTVDGVVRQAMSQAVMNNSRSGAAILRLFFHDCFVNGCDASLLLDDTPTTPGEKSAGANSGGSTFGFDLIDTIKTQVEAACPATVSCADILALAARDSVNLVHPPFPSPLPTPSCTHQAPRHALLSHSLSLSLQPSSWAGRAGRCR
ncbi:hypothetical protein HU200_067226 [Digitaria exilis]|uniref:Plant heme peroxidase family profile domain-containing protein n=1 Tax=Digitaria exilis TaxID=1010633 RepID=A0A834ZWM3_9POAL|nr:hypothetical protein HU200_067226 [Digitaria exilis]